MTVEKQSEYREGVFDLTNEEYHKHKAISRSAISELKKSPLHYWNKFINPDAKKEEKKADELNLGSAVHTLILEPEKFESTYAVMEEVDGRTTEGKKYKKLFQETSQGKTILTAEIFALAKNISKAIIEHPVVSVILGEPRSVEKSIFWIDEQTGLVCKARPDIWSHTLSTIFDLKTTNDASPENFAYSIKKYNYHIQAAMQLDAVFKNTGEVLKCFSIIAAPTESPHKPYIYVLDEETINQGRREYTDALKLLKACIDNKKWDLDREKPKTISLPHYNLNSNPFHSLMEIYQCQN